MIISQIKELLQITYMFTNIYYLKLRITFHLPLHVFAIGTGLHDKHFNHNCSFEF